jgi:hypothetical protein
MPFGTKFWRSVTKPQLPPSSESVRLLKGEGDRLGIAIFFEP